jgi:hypothetical protein
MPNLVDLIADHFPPVSGLNVPLQSDVTITFNELMDESRLEEDVFIEGPDTDQFVGPGLIELRDPNNVSQGDLDDFLQSPGYSGIVSVDYTFETIGGTQTKVTLNPTRPFAPSISYRVFIGETLTASGLVASGHLTWPFQTGTGSIEELPSDISTSILASAPQAISALSEATPLSVVSTVPANRSIEQDTDLSEIVVEFNKNLDASSIYDGSVEVETIPATGHPAAAVQISGDLYTLIQVEGNRLRIKI